MAAKYRLLAIGFLAIGVSGCVTDSGGFAVGMKGSPAWNKTAPEVDVTKYYDSLATYELCIEWAERWNSTGPRKNIAKALERRGEDPLKCNNPAEDATRRSAAQAAAAASKLEKQKRELEDLQDEIDEMKRDQSFKCIMSGGVQVGNSCL